MSSPSSSPNSTTMGSSDRSLDTTSDSSAATTPSASTASAATLAAAAATAAASTSSSGPSASRRHRYTRSSTSSVTQLLSDSCNSLLQRFRRNPSEKVDKRLNNRFELSPSKSAPDINSSSSKRDHMDKIGKRHGGDSGYSSSYSSKHSSALDRLRNNLSPVSSYYKPLMRTFGKRDDSPKKKDEDEDKTPVPSDSSKPVSTISRLESKYSDVLDRFAKRRGRRQEVDRDKTLEPADRPATATGNPVKRSATNVYLASQKPAIFKVASATGLMDRKERTPYRLIRNKNKYLDPIDAGYAKARAELAILNDNITDYADRHKNYHRTNNYDISPRYKDSIYDSMHPSSAAGNRYANIHDYSYIPRSALDHGYYESRRGKENTFKSKYDPDLLYSEINNNATDSYYRGHKPDTNPVSNRRQPRSYRRGGDLGDSRNYTTNYRQLLDYDLDRMPDTSAIAERIAAGGGGSGGGGSSGSGSNRSRKSSGLQRSQTQKFFDSEDVEDDRSSADIAAIIACLEEDNNPTAANEFKERMARRKEIKGLIMKYAQLDDMYNKSIPQPNDVANNNTNGHRSSNSNLMTSASSAAINRMKSPPGLSRINPVSNHNQNAFLPLSKTQSFSIFAPSSATTSGYYRSRIPKTLSTFVRI